MIQNNKIEVKLYPISRLKKMFDRKMFAVPKLQRDFVWNANKAAELMDSIYKKYPIGTILIWKAKKFRQFELNHHPSALPQYKSKGNKFIHFIIDGQQRLSVIYRIMKGDLIKNSKNEEINFGNIFFMPDVEDKRFRYLKNTREDAASLSDILSSYWTYKFSGTPSYKMKKLKQCRDSIYKYKVPFILVSGYDLDEIKQTFIRINSLGTPISSADQAFTLASSFNLKDRVKTVFKNLNPGYMNLPKEVILRTMVLIWGIESKNKKSFEDGLQFGMQEINSLSSKLDKNKDAQKRFNKIWKKLQYSYGQAVDYLMNEFKVKDYSDLPSENMIIQLATFFYYNKNAQPTIYEKQQIRKWFWSTGVGSRYSGRGYARNIISDFIYFRKLGLGRHLAFQISERVSKNSILSADYRTAASLNKAFYIMLALNEPKYLEGGGNIPLNDLVSLKNKTNKHHIFPRDFLKRRDVSTRKINSIANICFLVFKENLDAKNKPPAIYLNDYKKKNYYKGFLRSHLIPVKVEYGLYEKTKSGYNKFLARRTDLIAQKFEKLAGVKLFER